MFTCTVCDKTCATRQGFNRHNRGRSHLEAVAGAERVAEETKGRSDVEEVKTEILSPERDLKRERGQFNTTNASYILQGMVPIYT